MTFALPSVDKAVIYLDQFAISEIYKTRAGTRRPNANSAAFWEAVSGKVQQVVLLQQALFPSGSVHTEESMLYSQGDDLRLAHELLSGDVDLTSVEEIEGDQAWAFFQAFLTDGTPPRLGFDLDDVLQGDRNEWLTDLHISANMSYAQFASSTRAHRESGGDALAALAETWAREKPTFRAALQHELEAYGRAKIQAANAAFHQIARAMESNDVEAYTEGALNPHLREFLQLRDHLRGQGFDEADATAKVTEFWLWPGNHHQPYHRISSYLFAALARKAAAGQRRPPGRGTFSDIKAIAAYAPYVDAMFVDREWAGLLAEKPLCDELNLKARIFSLTNGDAFLGYLDSLAGQATPEVREYAREIYGAT